MEGVRFFGLRNQSRLFADDRVLLVMSLHHDLQLSLERFTIGMRISRFISVAMVGKGGLFCSGAGGGGEFQSSGGVQVSQCLVHK